MVPVSVGPSISLFAQVHLEREGVGFLDSIFYHF
jgi:hypothetical protein